MIVEPSERTIEHFRSDLIWLRREVLERTSLVKPETAKRFRLQIIEVLFAIWDEGKKAGKLCDDYIPVVSFDEDNHAYTVKYSTARIKAEITLSVLLRKKAGIWGAWEV